MFILSVLTLHTRVRAIHPLVYPSIQPPIHPLNYSTIHSSIYPSNHPSTHPPNQQLLHFFHTVRDPYIPSIHPSSFPSHHLPFYSTFQFLPSFLSTISTFSSLSLFFFSTSISSTDKLILHFHTNSYSQL
jgi:hypothetical protein